MTKKEADFFPEGHCFRGQKEIGRRGRNNGGASGGGATTPGKKLTKNVMLMKRFLRREGPAAADGHHGRLSQLNSVASTISTQSAATRTNSNSYTTTGGASSLFDRNSSVRSARSTKSNATVLTAVSSLTGSSSVYSSSSNSAYKKSKNRTIQHVLLLVHKYYVPKSSIFGRMCPPYFTKVTETRKWALAEPGSI